MGLENCSHKETRPITTNREQCLACGKNFEVDEVTKSLLFIKKHGSCEKSCKYLDQECQNLLQEKYHEQCVQFRRDVANALTKLKADQNTDEFIQKIKEVIK